MTTPPFLRIISMVCLSDLIGRAAQENMQMNDTKGKSLLCSAEMELGTSHKNGTEPWDYFIKNNVCSTRGDR